jgi:hypothetical protein
MQYYTGIGSRKSPEDAMKVMKKVAFMLATKGLCLRSGAAEGADSAFEEGCLDARGEKEIYLPWKRFNKHPSELWNVSDAAQELASRFHPAWQECSCGVRKMHGRNSYQVMGKDLQTPSLFVLYWTATDHGGTLQAIRIARHYNIPVYNMAEEGKCDYDKVMAFCDFHSGSEHLTLNPKDFETNDSTTELPEQKN